MTPIELQACLVAFTSLAAFLAAGYWYGGYLLKQDRKKK